MNQYMSGLSGGYMNEELSKMLLEGFPGLFRNQNETSMKFGFQCGDGWFELIYKLSQDIEAVAREGGLSPDSPEWPLCRQVKEKMGSLRFIVFGVVNYQDIYERISELRLEASNRSLHICERCGKPGELVTDGCIATLCSDHLCGSSTKRDSNN